MLGKLIKYDLMFGRRSFPAMAAVMLLAAILVRILNLNASAMGGGLATIFPLVIIFIFTYCVILVYQNYNRGLFSGEGYLTLTLPVKRYKLILSKFITSLIWFNLMLLTGWIIALLVLGDGGDIVATIQNTRFHHVLGLAVNLTVLNLLVANGILVLYLLATASNLSFAGRRTGWFVGAVFSAVFVTLEVLVGSRMLSPLLGDLSFVVLTVGGRTTFHLTSDLNALYDSFSSLPTLTMSLLNISMVVTVLLFGALAYLINLYLLKKRIDL